MYRYIYIYIYKVQLVPKSWKDPIYTVNKIIIIDKFIIFVEIPTILSEDSIIYIELLKR